MGFGWRSEGVASLAVLHRDVAMYVAQHSSDVLAGIRCSDRDIQLRLDRLRHELMQDVRNREPWVARISTSWNPLTR
jgi:hypothetical protein